ncbi:MAG TPA: GNAT family N-acetyltransferase, partial [Thermodesulfobacteriota bacterium]
MSGAAVSVRPIATLEEYRECMALQQAAFGYDDRFVEPLTQLVTAQRYGGHVLGAFDRDGTILGYLYSCPGLRDGELLSCFRILAVSPAARGLGIGERLLLALRDRALAAGIRTVVATFDPLEAANARLYLGKLGFRGLRFYPNHYGDLGRGQNAGLETDRLEIEWTLDAAAPTRRAADGEVASGRDAIPRITALSGGRGEWPSCTILRLDLDAERLLLEVPASIQALKAADLGLA